MSSVRIVLDLGDREVEVTRRILDVRTGDGAIDTGLVVVELDTAVAEVKAALYAGLVR